jgi:hypothetical protein
MNKAGRLIMVKVTMTSAYCDFSQGAGLGHPGNRQEVTRFSMGWQGEDTWRELLGGVASIANRVWRTRDIRPPSGILCATTTMLVAQVNGCEQTMEES